MSTKQKLEETIEELIRAKERELNYKLSIESFDFLKRVCLKFVDRNIHKFVAGSLEHGDNFLTDVDHAQELHNEICDSANYLAALLHKQRKFDIRYNQ